MRHPHPKPSRSESAPQVSRSVAVIGKQSMDAIFSKLESMLPSAQKQPPEGAFFITQYAQHKCIDVKTARKRLKLLLDAGKVERCGEFPCGPNRHPVTFYRIKA